VDGNAALKASCWIGTRSTALQLYYSPTSPYARKVRIVAIEKGLDGALQLVDATPWPEPTLVAERNPLGKVPTLILDSGEALFDSPVICEYLDVLGSGAPLIPPLGPDRWKTLRLQAVADGIMDAAVSIVLERRREPVQQSTAVVQRATVAIQRSIAYLAEEIGQNLTAPFDLGRIAGAVAIGYLQFRLPDLELGLSHPSLAAWWTLIQQRASVDATTPVSPS
jgi:glutathione S-transferase